METPADEPIPKRSDTTKFLRNWAFLRMAHEGLMVQRVRENAKKVERLEAFAASGNVEDLKAGEDDVFMPIGNEIHNHFEGVQPTATPPPNGTTTTQPTTGLSTLSKAAIAAALISGIGGTSYGVYQAVQPAPAVDTDSDTSIDVIFPD
jgi:hypothetical protein